MTTDLFTGIHAIVYTAQDQPNGWRDRNRGPGTVAMIVSDLDMTPIHDIRACVGSSVYLRMICHCSFSWSDCFEYCSYGMSTLYLKVINEKQ